MDLAYSKALEVIYVSNETFKKIQEATSYTDTQKWKKPENAVWKIKSLKKVFTRSQSDIECNKITPRENTRHLLIQIPVLIRCYSCLLLKKTGKMSRIFKAQVIGNFADGFMTIKNPAFSRINYF